MKLTVSPNMSVNCSNVLQLLILMSLIFQFFGIMIINFTIIFQLLFVKTRLFPFYSFCEAELLSDDG